MEKALVRYQGSTQHEDRSTQHGDKNWMDTAHEMLDVLHQTISDIWKKQEESDKNLKDAMGALDEDDERIDHIHEWCFELNRQISKNLKDNSKDTHELREMAIANMKDLVRIKHTTKDEIRQLSNRIHRIENIGARYMDPEPIAESFKESTNAQLESLTSKVEKALHLSKQYREDIMILRGQQMDIIERLQLLEESLYPRREYSYAHPTPLTPPPSFASFPQNRRHPAAPSEQHSLEPVVQSVPARP